MGPRENQHVLTRLSGAFNEQRCSTSLLLINSLSADSFPNCKYNIVLLALHIQLIKLAFTILMHNKQSNKTKRDVNVAQPTTQCNGRCMKPVRISLHHILQCFDVVYKYFFHLFSLPLCTVQCQSVFPTFVHVIFNFYL